MTNMEAFLIQHGTYIDISRAEMIDEYGSADGFITEGLGLGDHEIKQLRAELLE